MSEYLNQASAIEKKKKSKTTTMCGAAEVLSEYIRTNEVLSEYIYFSYEETMSSTPMP